MHSYYVPLLGPKNLSEMFVLLLHQVLQYFFSLFTSVYLLMNWPSLFLKRLFCWNWFILYWHLLILELFTLIPINISSFTFGFPFSFNLYLVCKLSWCFFFIFLPSNKAFSLPRSFLSSLTGLSSLLFHQGCFFSPFVLFFSNTLFTNATPRWNKSLSSVTSLDSILFKRSFTFLISVSSFAFSTFLRHGNLVLSRFQISDMFFSISFSSCSSSYLSLKPNSVFPCRLPISSTTSLSTTCFRNTCLPLSLKAKNHCSSSLSLWLATWPCSSSSILCVSSSTLTIDSLLSERAGW